LNCLGAEARVGFGREGSFGPNRFNHFKRIFDQPFAAEIAGSGNRLTMASPIQRTCSPVRVNGCRRLALAISSLSMCGFFQRGGFCGCEPAQQG